MSNAQNSSLRLVSFAHKHTGLLNAIHLTASDYKPVALNTPPDHFEVDGHHDHLSTRVDFATGNVIDYQPPAPSVDHEWNANTKRWVVKAAVVAARDAQKVARAQIAKLEAQGVRATREMLLGMAGAHDRLAAIEASIAELRQER
jgi:hypothetical protein